MVDMDGFKNLLDLIRLGGELGMCGEAKECLYYYSVRSFFK